MGVPPHKKYELEEEKGKEIGKVDTYFRAGAVEGKRDSEKDGKGKEGGENKNYEFRAGARRGGKAKEVGILFLNTQGAQGAMEMINNMLEESDEEDGTKRPEVVCLLDVALETEHWRAYRRIAKRKGYIA